MVLCGPLTLTLGPGELKQLFCPDENGQMNQRHSVRTIKQRHPKLEI